MPVNPHPNPKSPAPANKIFVTFYVGGYKNSSSNIGFLYILNPK